MVVVSAGGQEREACVCSARRERERRQHGEAEPRPKPTRRQHPRLFHQCACSMPLQSPSPNIFVVLMSSRLSFVTWINQSIIPSHQIHVQRQSNQISIRRSFTTARAKRFKAGSQRPSPFAPSGEAPCLPSSPRLRFTLPPILLSFSFSSTHPRRPPSACHTPFSAI